MRPAPITRMRRAPRCTAGEIGAEVQKVEEELGRVAHVAVEEQGMAELPVGQEAGHQVVARDDEVGPFPGLQRESHPTTGHGLGEPDEAEHGGGVHLAAGGHEDEDGGHGSVAFGLIGGNVPKGAGDFKGKRCGGNRGGWGRLGP